MFYLNKDNDDPVKGENWKCLIYDERGLDLILPFFNLDEIYKHRITYHSLINDPKRISIPFNPVIYFVKPNETNFELIANDFKNGMYAEYYIYFTSFLTQDESKKFARIVKTTVNSNVPKIKLVYSSYLDFSTMHPTLFQLFDSKYPLHINDFYSRTADANLQMVLHKQIAASLMSVLTTWGAPPFILYDNDTTEPFSHELHNLFNDVSLKMKFEKAAPAPRPILILVHRNFDFITPLSHTRYYEPLIHDLIGIERNTIAIDDQRRKFNLIGDDFWDRYHCDEFNNAEEVIVPEFNKFEKKVQTVTNMSMTSFDDYEKTMQWKENVSCHIHIVRKLQQIIEQTSINKLTMFEEEPSSDKIKDREIVEKFPVNDKIRTLAFLYNFNIIRPNNLTTIAQKFNIVDEIQFATNPMFRFPNPEFKNGEFQCPMVRLARKILDNDGDKIISEKTKNFQIYDPLTGSVNGFNFAEFQKIERKNVIFFVIGPGCYQEYVSLFKYANESGRSITYGCTTIPRPNSYLEELKQLN